MTNRLGGLALLRASLMRSNARPVKLCAIVRAIGSLEVSRLGQVRLPSLESWSTRIYVNEIRVSA